jgi:hypothetical protein
MTLPVNLYNSAGGGSLPKVNNGFSAGGGGGFFAASLIITLQKKTKNNWFKAEKDAAKETAGLKPLLSKNASKF